MLSLPKNYFVHSFPPVEGRGVHLTSNALLLGAGQLSPHLLTPVCWGMGGTSVGLVFYVFSILFYFCCCQPMSTPLAAPMAPSTGGLNTPTLTPTVSSSPSKVCIVDRIEVFKGGWEIVELKQCSSHPLV